MQVVSKTDCNVLPLAEVIGLIFQIQDDYKNISSDRVIASKTRFRRVAQSLTMLTVFDRWLRQKATATILPKGNSRFRSSTPSETANAAIARWSTLSRAAQRTTPWRRTLCLTWKMSPKVSITPRMFYADCTAKHWLLWMRWDQGVPLWRQSLTSWWQIERPTRDWFVSFLGLYLFFTRHFLSDYEEH